MTALSVNLNKIALLRNSRQGDFPSVVNFCRLALESGAEGVTVHPRPDQRHVRVSDVFELMHYINDFNEAADKTIEFNIEGNPFAAARESYPGFMSLVDATRPHQATLVPDGDAQLTSDHGFDLLKEGELLLPIIETLRSWGVRSSVFVDVDCQQIKTAKQLGFDRIELYTGPYAQSCRLDVESRAESLSLLKEAIEYGLELGLGINAGHDLNQNNLPALLSLGAIDEVSIGHALTVDALLNGYKQTIVDYKKICSQ